MGNSIIVLCGAGGSGKDTTLNILKKQYSNLQACVSHTTRPMRQGEVEGREYFFIDNAEFESLYEQGQFIETRTYHVATEEISHYGMSEGEVTNKLMQGHVIMILDLQGLLELKKYYQDTDVDIHAFYINVDEDVRLDRYLKRDKMTVKVVHECLRRIDADKIDFMGIENHATFINNPPTSEMTAYAIWNYLANRGVILE